jgi:hypothetical protein
MTPLTKADQRYSLYLLSHLKITTERFATIGPISGKLRLSGVRKTRQLQLTTIVTTGEI